MKSIGDSAVLMRHIVSGIVAPPLSPAAVCFAMVFVPKAGERGVRAQRFSDEHPLWFSATQVSGLPGSYSKKDFALTADNLGLPHRGLNFVQRKRRPDLGGDDALSKQLANLANQPQLGHDSLARHPSGQPESFDALLAYDQGTGIDLDWFARQGAVEQHAAPVPQALDHGHSRRSTNGIQRKRDAGAARNGLHAFWNRLVGSADEI